MSIQKIGIIGTGVASVACCVFLPSPVDPPSGCVFHTRCPIATARCKTEVPLLRDLNPNQKVACYLV